MSPTDPRFDTEYAKKSLYISDFKQRVFGDFIYRLPYTKTPVNLTELNFWRASMFTHDFKLFLRMYFRFKP